MRSFHLSLAVIAWSFCSASWAKSILFEHGTVITLDEETQSPLVMHNTSILITDDRISAIFNSFHSNVTIPSDTERVDATNDIISPGFVDTHRHVWQTVQRSLGSTSSLAEYLGRWSSFTLAAEIFDPEVIYYSELVGLCEALNAGVTTIVDNASGGFTQNVTDATINGAIESGIRNFYAYPIRRGISGFTWDDQIAHFKELVTKHQATSGLLSLGLAYEAFDTGSTEDIQDVVNLAKQSNISVLQTHFVGGPMGLENSPSRLQPLELLNQTFPVIFVHANAITPTDLTILRNTDHYIAIAPEFEMHHGQDLQGPSLAQDQASLSVGTHYTQSGDLITQARIWLQYVRSLLYTKKIREFKFPSNNPMSTNQAFHLATRAGGLALRRPDLGVIQVGAKADIAIFDGAAPGLLGWQDAVTAVIMHSNVGNIKHVLVDGQWRKRDGELLCALNQTLTQESFLKAARKVQQYWETVPEPDFNGSNPATGAVYGEIEYVDVVRGSFDGFGCIGC